MTSVMPYVGQVCWTADGCLVEIALLSPRFDVQADGRRVPVWAGCQALLDGPGSIRQRQWWWQRVYDLQPCYWPEAGEA